MGDDSTNEKIEDVQDAPATPTKFDRAKFLTTKLKTGVKNLLDRDDPDSGTDEEDASDLFEDAAFNPQQVLQASPHEPGSLRDKVYREAQGLATLVKNPRRALRSKYTRRVAGNLTGEPASYEKKLDEDLVDAYDALGHANAAVGQHGLGIGIDGSPSPSAIQARASDLRDFEAGIDHPETPSNDVEEAKARIRQVEDQRDSLRAAWILGRHVKRVRVARQMPHPPRKPDFVQESPNGQDQMFQWDRYLAAAALWHTRNFTPYHIDDFDELPFDLRELSLAIERLVVISAPWQNFLMEVRDVYLWKQPQRTLKFAIGYFVLWFFQYIMTAIFAWIILATLRNWYQPTRIETIRERVQRARGDQARAQAWGELIQRHGKHDWVEPLLDDIGPMLQLEVSDLSNLMEIVQSFYRWERPSKTLASLFPFGICVLFGLFADTQFCLRLVWLGVGLFFFVSLPLCARYPKYRRLFNPIYWIFWDIPNQAELAIAQLQEKAIMKDAAMLENTQRKSLIDEDEDLNVSESDCESVGDDAKKANYPQDVQATFRTVHSKTQQHGRLRLLRHGLWYYDKKLKLYHPYSHLVEIRKVDISQANDPDASKTARLARRIQESTSLQFLPSGIEFTFLPQSTQQDDNGFDSKRGQANQASSTNDEEKLALTISESDRNKAFSLVIGWSNLKWQPMFSLNQRYRLSQDADHPSKHGKGNEDLDNAIKSFVH